jgi:hypothetical protein
VTAIASGQTRPPATKINRVACRAAIEAAERVLKSGAMLLVGEIHGTNEIERAFGDLVCQAASAGTPVWVGLEIPTDEQSAVAAFLASRGSSCDRRKLLEESFWNDSKDGRSSQAMLDLLDRLREFKNAGLQIHVVPFVPAAFDAHDYEAVLAKALLAVWDKHPHDQFLILVGNAHGRSVNQSMQGKPLPSMAGNLRRANPALIALRATYAGGTAWNCLQESTGELKCGPHPSGGTDAGNVPSIRLNKVPDADGYAGTFYVGQITASPPGATMQEDWQARYAARIDALIQKNGSGTNPQLKQELLKMVEEDQSIRKDVMSSPEEQRPALTKEMEAIDTRLTARLKEIVAQNGWPTIALVGAKASQAAATMLIHSPDHDWQTALLPELEALVAKDEIIGSDMALLADKISVSRGELQVFGTQFKRVEGKIVMLPVKNPERLEERRCQYLLPPISVYRKMLGDAYHPPVE